MSLLLTSIQSSFADGGGGSYPDVVEAESRQSFEVGGTWGHAEVELPAEFAVKKNVTSDPALIKKLREIDELESKVNNAQISQGVDIVETLTSTGVVAFLSKIGLEMRSELLSGLRDGGFSEKRRAKRTIGLLAGGIVVGLVIIGDESYDFMLTAEHKKTLLADIAKKKKEIKAEIAAGQFAIE